MSNGISKDKILEKMENIIKSLHNICEGEKITVLEKYKAQLAEILEKAILLANFDREIPGHELAHTFRVLKLSIAIACYEGGDVLKIAIAALLHDVGRVIEEKGGDHHALVSANIAKKVLSGTIFSKLANDVAQIIREHSFSLNKSSSSLESRILQDADRLDALGAIGIARVFAYGGFKGRCISEPLIAVESKKCSIDHFYEKILKLPFLINTTIARKLAASRCDKVKKFLDMLKEEMELKDLEKILSSRIEP